MVTVQISVEGCQGQNNEVGAIDLAELVRGQVGDKSLRNLGCHFNY